jgi:hypothetical protein
MAVSGEGRLAAIPVFGAVARRLIAVRDRTASLMPSLSQLGAPIAAGAMAAVITSAPFASAPATAPIVAHRVDRVDVRTATPPTTVAPAAVTAAPTGHTHRAPALQAAPKPAPGVETMTDEQARSEAQSMPVFVDVAGITAGIDPMQPTGWLPFERNDR